MRSAQRAFAHAGDNYDEREWIISYGVFAGCRTGRNLIRTLGEELCRELTAWENASKFCGVNHDDDHGGADPDHMVTAIEFWKPEVVVAFGAVAAKPFGVSIDLESMPLVIGPHPARCAFADLLTVKREVMEVLDAGTYRQR
jgi:hypothetical protein